MWKKSRVYNLDVIWELGEHSFRFNGAQIVFGASCVIFQENLPFLALT